MLLSGKILKMEIWKFGKDVFIPFRFFIVFKFVLFFIRLRPTLRCIRKFLSDCVI